MVGGKHDHGVGTGAADAGDGVFEVAVEADQGSGAAGLRGGADLGAVDEFVGIDGLVGKVTTCTYVLILSRLERETRKVCDEYFLTVWFLTAIQVEDLATDCCFLAIILRVSEFWQGNCAGGSGR